MEPPQGLSALLTETTVLKYSITTSDGNAGGTTLIDSALTEATNNYWTGTAVILSGACKGQKSDISSFTAATDTIAVGTAFATKIVSGVRYAILAFEPATVEVAALEAKVDEIPAETGTKTFNAIALAAIHSEVEKAIEDTGQVMVITTIATLATQTSFTLTAGSADDDAYNGMIAVVEDATTARMTRDGLHFEILVDPDLALRYRKGEELGIENILAAQFVYSDAKKGEKASGEDLKKVFKTHDIFVIASSILRHGELQLTTDQRRKFTEEKRKQIADIISKQGIDPKTKMPHPPQRIMNAMEQAKVHIDPFREANDQLKEVLEKVQEVLPISLERVEVAIRVPMSYAGKASSAVRSMAPVKSEEWRSDAWIAVIEIPAGMQSDIYDKLNSLTGGTVETKILKEHKV